MYQVRVGCSCKGILGDGPEVIRGEALSVGDGGVWIGWRWDGPSESRIPGGGSFGGGFWFRH